MECYHHGGVVENLLFVKGPQNTEYTVVSNVFISSLSLKHWVSGPVQTRRFRLEAIAIRLEAVASN